MNEPSRYDDCFGDVAVRLGLINGAQLARLTAAAAGDATPLRQRLVDGALVTAEQAEIIAAAVDQRMANHSDADETADDPAATRALASGGFGTQAAESSPASSFSTRAPQPDDAVSEGDRFLVLRPHAQGGLGRVSIARDRQLNREIALKEILPTHADDPASRQRFVREAEITGALEHPGVVPVYSYGVFPDGRPFYAMRFVLGQDLRKEIDQYHQSPGRRVGADLQSRQLLGRFIDACQAIDYAHNRRVVHRDIKPENIMLGDFGETLVVDWGLARACDAPPEDPSEHRPVTPSSQSAASHTRDGQVVGTPAYMSPEQAEGRLDLLGPSSDVYSLGATLYHLLVGRAPFASGQPDLLDAVQRGRFETPRERNHRVPRPLQAICLRAMARSAAHRYPTARSLALDIERFLADEKVDAFDEPVWMQAWRWMRNHRTAVFSLFAAVSVALAALSAGVILLGAANQRERAAKNEATQNLAESVKQRQRAEENFQLAQQAVSEFYVQVSEDTLLSQPGMQPLRNALLSQALAYYEQFLTQRAGDPELRSELARAAFYVGRITETVASPERALPHYRQALEHYQQVADDGAAAEALARTHNALGGAYQKLSRIDDARRHYQQARDLRQQIASRDPTNVEAARELGNTVMNLGALAMLEQQTAEGLQLMEHAQAIRLAHITGAKPPLKLQRDLAKGYFNLAAAQIADGDSAAAERNLLAAAKSFANLVDEEPQVWQHRRRLSLVKRLLGDLAAQAGNVDQAVDFYRDARDENEKLVRDNPSVPEYATDLAGVLMNLGALQSQSFDTDRALANFEQAATLLATLASDPDAVPRYQRDLAAAQRAAGQVLAAMGRTDEARERLNASRDVLQGLVRRFPESADYADQLGQTFAAMTALDADDTE